MIDEAQVDVKRVAVLWLKDGSFLELPEEGWADEVKRKPDAAVAYHLVKGTGLKVTVRTETQTTASPAPPTRVQVA